ncbi:MAG: nuclear transport factor 2 family protein [Alphaproteobacteria bacterium]|nr:MAG: nuclear transport factor 2 family protein [Alphaproteobacteria bacterium]
MTSAENKARMAGIMQALSEGDGRPFVAAMAEDFAWMICGNTHWSGLYQGRDTVQRELLAPLFAQFADRYRNTAHRILADGDFVVVECTGRVMTKTGKPYNNSYCYVIRMQGGMMKQLTEYLDTALVDSALEPPRIPA